MTKQEANQKWPKRNGMYYFDIDGKEVILPAVTEILRVLAKPALVNWAAKEAAKIALDNPTLTEKEVVGQFGQISGNAATRGRGVHNFFQQILNNQYDIDAPEQYRPYLEGIIRFQKEYQVTPIFNERIVKSLKYGYAGTVDQAVKTNNQTWLIDLKTSKQIYPEMGLQLECYKQALVEEGFKIDKTAILLVPGDGTFQLAEVKGDIEVFLALKKVWEWMEGLK